MEERKAPVAMMYTYSCLLHTCTYTAAGEDFSLANNMVTFGVSSATGDMQCLQIMVVGDSDYESDETAIVGLTITGPGQAGSVNSATLMIMNDDE